MVLRPEYLYYGNAMPNTESEVRDAAFKMPARRVESFAATTALLITTF
jgi:hypothetical protein